MFNFSDVVLSDGSVSTTTTKSLAVDIINKDVKSATVILTLVNPKTGEKGLPEALQNAYVIYKRKTWKRFSNISGN